MFDEPAFRKATIFFARFVLIAGLLYVGWVFVSTLYLSTLVAVYNRMSDADVQYALYGSSLVIVYEGLLPGPLVLGLKDNDIFFMNLLVVLGLLLATPGSSHMRHRARWLLGAAVLVWATHILSLIAGQYLAIWDFVRSLGEEQMIAMAQLVDGRFPESREAVLRAIFERWRLWVRPTLALLLWFYVARSYLRLDVEAAPAAAKP